MATNTRNETLNQRVATIVQQGRHHPTKSSQEIADEVLQLVNREVFGSDKWDKNHANDQSGVHAESAGCTKDKSTCGIAYCDFPKCNVVG